MARDLAAACGGANGAGAGAEFIGAESANGGAPASGGAARGGTCAGAAVSADSADGCGLKTRGTIRRPASAAAARVPNIAGRQRARFAVGRCGPAATAAACSSTLRRTASLGRLVSRADARR